MNPSQHARSLLARIALAAGGIGALFAIAAVAYRAAAAYGTLAGILIAGAVFGGCGLVSGLRTFRVAGLTRPAPVRLPDPAADDLEPVNALS